MSGWRESTRRQRLPADWPRIRKRILKRDKFCRMCDMNPSRDVDHIVPGDNHGDANLRGVCGSCHAVKSSQEGISAQKRISAARRRTPEKHPSGL